MSEGSCHFCSETACLETHHIVPDRHGGSDKDGNLVDVCPTCHSKLESMYDARFYKSLGVDKHGGEAIRFLKAIEDVYMESDSIEMEREVILSRLMERFGLPHGVCDWCGCIAYYHESASGEKCKRCGVEK
jgi:hypothetical protein